MAEKRRHRLHAKTRAKRQPHDQHIATAQRGLGNNPDPGRHHAAKHHHRGAPQHRRRDLPQQFAHRGKQPEQDQNHANVASDIAAGHPGHLDHAVVLREGGVRKSTEHGRHHTADAIRQDTALQPVTESAIVNRLLRNQRVGRQIAHRLQNTDQRHQGDRQKYRAVKLKAERKQRRQAKQGVAQAVKMELTAQPRCDAAHGNAHHHRGEPQPAVFGAAQQDDNPEGARPERDIAHAGEILGLFPTAPVDDADLDQADADQRNHAAGNDGSKDFLQRFDKAADNHRHQSGDKVNAKQHRHHILRPAALGFYPHPSGHRHAEEGKTGALHADHPGADAPYPIGLQKSANARGQQRHTDEIRQPVAKPEGSADDQRRRDDPHQARQHMLESAEKGRKRWDPLFKAVKQATVMFVRHSDIP